MQMQTIETHNEIANKWNSVCYGKRLIFKCNRKQSKNTMQLQTN